VGVLSVGAGVRRHWLSSTCPSAGVWPFWGHDGLRWFLPPHDPRVLRGAPHLRPTCMLLRVWDRGCLAGRLHPWAPPGQRYRRRCGCPQSESDTRCPMASNVSTSVCLSGRSGHGDSASPTGRANSPHRDLTTSSARSVARTPAFLVLDQSARYSPSPAESSFLKPAATSLPNPASNTKPP